MVHFPTSSFLNKQRDAPLVFDSQLRSISQDYLPVDKVYFGISLHLHHLATNRALRPTLTSHSKPGYSRVVSISDQRVTTWILSRFIDNANHLPSTHSVQSSVGGSTITLPSPLQIPQRAAIRSPTNNLYMPVRRISLETVSSNPTVPLEEHRPRRSSGSCKYNYMVLSHISNEYRPDMTWYCTQCLNVDRLSAITSFERYECAIWDLRTVYIIFYVKYNDGSEGYVYGGPAISGRTSSETQLLYLRCKVIAAKALLGDEEWSRLQKYGVERDRILTLNR